MKNSFQSARMRRYLILDGFFPDPDGLRGLALATKFNKMDPAVGSEYNGHFSFLPENVVTLAVKRVSEAVGRRLRHDKAGVMLRYLTRRDYERKTTSVHCDNYDWSGIVCLNPKMASKPATRFFRHKATGLYGFHDAEECESLMRDYGLDFAGLQEKIFRDSKNASAWREVMRAEYAYNRLILFNGRLFHASAPGFGKGRSDAKMTVNLFFREA